MNQKAEKFDLLVADLNKGGNSWFTKEEMTDDLHTVVYHGRLDVHNHSLPVFIVVDDSAFSYARIAITTTSIDEKVIPAVLKELNTLNQDYKVSKYYVSTEDNNIYMDVSVPALTEQFDPTVVVNLLLEVVQPHLDAVHKGILKVAGFSLIEVVMNPKALLFDKFLKEEEITSFERKDFDDEDGTVVYRSYIKSPLWDMPLFVILDNSIYSVIRLVLGPEKVTAQNMAALNALINRDNATSKNYKLYIDEQDSSLYLDCVYMCGDDAFEPALMYALMSSIVDYIPESVGELKTAFESGTH